MAELVAAGGVRHLGPGEVRPVTLCRCPEQAMARLGH